MLVTVAVPCAQAHEKGVLAGTQALRSLTDFSFITLRVGSSIEAGIRGSRALAAVANISAF